MVIYILLGIVCIKLGYTTLACISFFTGGVVLVANAWKNFKKE